MGFVMFILLLVLVYLTVIKPDHGDAVWEWLKSLFSGGAGPTAAALLALALLAGAANAQCLTVDGARDIAKQRGDKFVELTAAQVVLMTADYNATEPKSDDKFDRIVVVSASGHNLVLMFRDGCAVAKGMLTDAHLLRVLGQEAYIPTYSDPDPKKDEKKDGGGGGGWIS